MAHSNLSHRRTHNLLLISKLINQRDNTSPFTLVLDTLEQTANPLVKEYIRRANLSKIHIIYLGFETVDKPAGVDSFISCYNKSPAQITAAVSAVLSTTASKRTLIIIDSMHTLSTLSNDTTSNLNLTAYLSSFLAPVPSSPPSNTSSQTQTSLIAIYHTDIPIPTTSPTQSYQPSPISLLSYLATTILTIHPLAVLLAAKIAQERSQMPPSFGLSEEREGVIIGLKPTKFRGSVLRAEDQGLILELEHRRKSGRGVCEWFFLPANINTTANPPIGSPSLGTASSSTQAFREPVILLDDHPLFRRQKENNPASEPELTGLTFELGLTDRQKLEREGVVLPYHDAQRGDGLGGPGEGGRILYDMGSEDDFDEEEDEI